MTDHRRDITPLTNPADGAAEHAAAYVAAIRSLVEGHDPLEVLRATPSVVADAVSGRDEATLRAPERPGKWSAAQVVQHLADSELVWGYRLRRILAEDRPTIFGFDQDAWAGRLRYADAPVDRALAVFTALRAANLDLLEAAGDEELDRVGVHEERGEESVRGMIPLYAGHDLAHRNQLARILAGGGGTDAR